MPTASSTLRMQRFPQVTLVASVTLLVTLAMVYIVTRSRPVYLIDFALYKAPSKYATPSCHHYTGRRSHAHSTTVCQCMHSQVPVARSPHSCASHPDPVALSVRLKSSHEWFSQHSAKVEVSLHSREQFLFSSSENLKSNCPILTCYHNAAQTFTQQSLEFQNKIMTRSGLGNETYLPDGVRTYPADKSMASARAEAEMVMFGVMDQLFQQTGRFSPSFIASGVQRGSMLRRPSTETVSACQRERR